MLTFGELTLRQRENKSASSKRIRSDEGLTLEMSALESLYGGLVNYFDKMQRILSVALFYVCLLYSLGGSTPPSLLSQPKFVLKRSYSV